MIEEGSFGSTVSWNYVSADRVESMPGGANMTLALLAIPNGRDGSRGYGSYVTCGFHVQPQVDCLKKSRYIP